MALPNGSKNYLLFSFALWQINSTEKLKAKAKATVSHKDWFFANEIIIIIKQNKLTITVNAFFSDKYFFICGGLIYKAVVCANLSYPSFFLLSVRPIG